MYSNYTAQPIINSYQPEIWKVDEFINKLTADIVEVNSSGLLGTRALVKTSNEVLSLQEELQDRTIKYLIAFNHQSDSLEEPKFGQAWINQSQSEPKYYLDYYFEVATSIEEAIVNEIRDLEIIFNDLVKSLTASRQVDSATTTSQFVEITLSADNGAETFKTKPDQNYFIPGSKTLGRELFNTEKPLFQVLSFNILFQIYKQL